MTTKTNSTINGRQYYRIRRTIDGEMKNFYGRSKGEAERKYKEYLEDLARKKYETFRQMDEATFGERAEEYVEDVLSVSQKYAKGTIDAYTSVYRSYIKDTPICSMRMKDVKAMDIQRFYNSLDVSQQKIKAIHKFMSVFFKWLVLCNYSTNVLAAVEIPKKRDNSRHDEIIIWEPKEIREIIRSMNHVPASSARHRQFFLVHLMLYSGLRISECLGLRYTDIRDGMIHVERQYYLGEIKEPKWNSKRIVPMHHKLSQAFKAHERWHREEMEKNGYTTEYVFTTSTGQLYHSASVRKALNRFYDSRKIPRKNPHVYRATFCTTLCRCGCPMEVASRMLGHKNLETTAAHYRLVQKDTMQDVIGKLSYKI